MLEYRLLTQNDLPQMEALAERVMEELPEKRWYFYCEGDPQQWLREGSVLGCLDGEKLVGIAAYSPAGSDTSHSYAAVVGDEPQNTLDFHDIMVDPQYRRRGIHAAFSQSIRREAERLGIRGIYLTIDPDNAPSRKAFEKAGYRCLLIQPAYDGRMRCYYCLKFNHGGSDV